MSADGLQTSLGLGGGAALPHRAFLLHSVPKSHGDSDKCEYSCPELF